MDALLSTASTLTPFITANFLPRFLASLLIDFMDRASHGTPIRRFWKPARKGTPDYVSNWKKALTAVLVFYFVYNSYGSYSSLASQARTSTPYAVLGVPTTVTEAQLKAASRQMALRYHPDRNPNDEYAEEMFVRGREAGELLSDKVLKQGYDRFGPSLIHALNFGSSAAPTSSKTAHNHTTRDIYHLGLARMGWWWLQVSGVQIGMSYFATGGLDFTKIYILLLGLFTELSLILRPTSGTVPQLFHFALPRLLPFQHILLLHAIIISSLVTFPQLLALWSSDGQVQPATNAGEEETQKRQLENVLNDLKMIVGKQGIRTWMGLSDMVSGVAELGKKQGLEVEGLIRSEIEEVMIDRAFKDNAPSAKLWREAVERHAASRSPTGSDTVEVGAVP